MTRRPVRAVVCDIDHTLTTESSPAALIRTLGLNAAEWSRLYRAYRAGEIGPSQAREVLVGMLDGVADRGRLPEILASVGLRPDAFRLADGLRERGVPLGLITSSFQMYADVTARRLGACCGHGNITFAPDGDLRDLEFEVDTAGHKVRQLRRFAAEHRLALADIVCVGNNHNDLGMFAATGRGVLVDGAQTRHYAAHAWATVGSLADVPALVDDPLPVD